jgi:predicted amidohydrolase YtcJ
MTRNALALLLIASTLASCHREPPLPAADLVLTGGDLRTMEPTLAGATALVVRDGRIAYVGSDQEASRWIGPKTQVVKASGHTVLPGLIDSHIHAAEGALARGGCSLGDDPLTIEQASPLIRACLEKDTGTGWLQVTDVNPAGFQANRKQLDAITSTRPLFLWGTDSHTAWVNSRALELAKITRRTANPADGRIERDAHGEATGFLVDGAIGLVLGVMEKPSPAKRIAVLKTVQTQLHAVGITSILEANTDFETVTAYADLAGMDELRMRVTIALESNGQNTPAEFARLKNIRAQVAAQPLIRADFIKLIADGVMEYPTQTAAMLEPYLVDGKPGKSSGKLYLTPGGMADFIQQANIDDFNIHVHAIGDAAVRETLNAFAAARAAGNQHSFSIAHLQLIDPADIPRFAKINVLASLQLLWAKPDNYSIEAVKAYIGDERLARTYPARALVASGAVVAGGSDWDVSSFNPFEAMAAGMSRINPEEPARGALNADQALTLDEMLAAYTINAARVLAREKEIGSLVAGKAADFVILDRQLTSATTADEVRQTKPARTFFAGSEVTP